jgi:hypothetical protein
MSRSPSCPLPRGLRAVAWRLRDVYPMALTVSSVVTAVS